jgi:NADPH2:quinone reductase
LIFCGNASGPVPPIDPLDLMRCGSLTMTRPSLPHYIATPAAFRARADAVFAMMSSGELRVRIGKEFTLAQAAQAQDLLCGRGSVGKLVLRC